MEKIITNKILLLVVLMIVCAFHDRVTGQTLEDSIVTENGIVYTKVKVRPEFPGGISAFFKYITKNFRVPKKLMVDGKIIAQFVIDTDGSLTQIKIIKDLGEGTAQETERVLRNSPKWKPGESNGKAVKTFSSLPINIKR